jgi:hypothetical protein
MAPAFFKGFNPSAIFLKMPVLAKAGFSAV